MVSEYDVIVIGGGLAAFASAITAAKNKAKTLIVYPKLAKVASPSLEAGIEILGIGLKTMAAFKEVAGCPPPYYTETYGFRFLSPYGGVVIDQRVEKPSGATLMVTEAMDILAKRARLVGVERREAAVTDILMDGSRATGVMTDDGELAHSKTVIGAFGYNPKLSERLGVEPAKIFVKAVQTRVEIKEPSNKNLVFTWFSGKKWTGGGSLGGFMMPLSEGISTVEVATLPQQEPLDYLEAVIREHPIISREVVWKRKDVHRGVIGLGLASRSYGDGFLLAGEAAGQVRSVGGLGTISALVFGAMAGEEAVKAIREGDTSARRLAGYEERWRSHPVGEKIVSGVPYSGFLRGEVDDEHIEKAFEALKGKPITEDFYFLLARTLKEMK